MTSPLPETFPQPAHKEGHQKVKKDKKKNYKFGRDVEINKSHMLPQKGTGDRGSHN